MKSKIFTLLKFLVPLIFWCGIWEIASIIIDNNFLLPGIPETLEALGGLVIKEGFYLSIFYSLIRVSLGLLFGIVIGILLAFICHYFKIADYVVNPMMTVIKSTPVASFIVLLWVLMSGDALSVFIGFLMVMPIIWQNVTDGFSAIDKEMEEVCHIFEFSFLKKMRLLILPTIKKFLIPGIITATGLAWKAEIAAEIIAYTKKSIGQGINDAKYNMNTAEVFAWTIIIIAFSILLEKATKALLGRLK